MTFLAWRGLRKDGKATQPVSAFSQGREVLHEDLFGHFSLSQLNHCVWRAKHGPTLTNTQQTEILSVHIMRALLQRVTKSLMFHCSSHSL